MNVQDAWIGRDFAGYRIESRIGEGGMGTVYLAEQVRLRRRVALKLLTARLAEDEDFRFRFIRESQLAAACEHPNVIPIYDAAEGDGVLYIAMRYIPGSDLRSVLRREGTLTPERTVGIVEQAAGALDATHATGLVHRDVKPGNILVGHDGHVYLTDFGVARQTSAGGLTRTGFFLGTLDYAAPEQIEGKPVTPATDVYSLGCVAFECLAGEPPFVRASDLAVLHAHLADAPPQLSDRRPGLPARLDGVIDTALAKNPEVRFQSCGSLAGALAAALADGAPPPAPADSAVATRKATTPRRPPAEASGAVPSRSTTLLAAALAFPGAAALLPAVWISLSSDVRITLWNTQAVLSALEGLVVAVSVAVLASMLLAGRVRPALAAGAFIGFGALSFVAALALRSFADTWLDIAPGVALLPLACVAVLAAGFVCLRAPGAAVGGGGRDPAVLWLGAVGVLLMFVALFVDYDGDSALIDEANAFVPEPVTAIAAAAVALGVVGLLSRGLLGTGMLLAVGAQTALHYLGVLGAAWKAIGEPGEVRAGGFVGLVGGLLVAAAGLYAYRATMSAGPDERSAAR